MFFHMLMMARPHVWSVHDRCAVIDDKGNEIAYGNIHSIDYVPSHHHAFIYVLMDPNEYRPFAHIIGPYAEKNVKPCGNANPHNLMKRK